MRKWRVRRSSQRYLIVEAVLVLPWRYLVQRNAKTKSSGSHRTIEEKSVEHLRTLWSFLVP